LDGEALSRLTKALEKNEDYAKSPNRNNRDVSVNILNLSDNLVPSNLYAQSHSQILTHSFIICPVMLCYVVLCCIVLCCVVFCVCRSGLLKACALSLTVLNLSSNTGTKFDYEVLATALGEVGMNLQEFYFANNGLADKALPRLVSPFVVRLQRKLSPPQQGH